MVCRRRGNSRSGGWVIQLGLVVRSGVTFVLVWVTGAPFILLLTMELAVCLLPSKTSKDLIGWLGVTCGKKKFCDVWGFARVVRHPKGRKTGSREGCFCPWKPKAPTYGQRVSLKRWIQANVWDSLGPAGHVIFCLLTLHKSRDRCWHAAF